MRTFFLFYLVSRLIGNPVMALMVLLLVYLMVDRKYIGLMPDVTRGWRRAGRLRQLKGLVALRPFDASAQLELGTLLFEAGKVQEALPYLEMAGNKLPDHASALFTLGAARVEVGKFASGLTALRQAITLRPEVQYGMPYVYLAKAALGDKLKASDNDAAGEHDAAAENTQAELQPWIDTVARFGNVEACYKMGLVLERGGLAAQARSLYQEAILNYRQSPAFARREGRRWALRARLRMGALRG